MQIYFTDDEKKYIDIDFKDNEYALICKNNAPPKIKKSIKHKLSEHKKWLKGDE